MPENMPLQPATIFTPHFPKTRPMADVPARISAASNNRQVMKRLERGESYCFEGTWGTAMAFYSWLKKQVNEQYPVADYASSRSNREQMARLTRELYIPIHNHHPTLAKAPGNTWLREFYPGQTHFLLRFTDYLGMNGARQWFEKGITFPGLAQRVHPFYGTYFPTRTEHLELFDQWLENQKSISKAIDMGTGCGVLTFYMLKHGISNIIATDINPNALFSLQQDLRRTHNEEQVELQQTSFFEGLDARGTQLIVFNPPWLPMEGHTDIDKAMYYSPDFFETFFAQAFEKLPEDCLLAIVFSSFAQAAGLSGQNPIEIELESGGRFILKEKLSHPIQQKASPRKDWLSQIRMHEEAELWVLRKSS